MPTPLRSLLVLTLVAACVLAAPSAAAADTPFLSTKYPQAIKLSEQGKGGILVVMGTASWCGPCKHMKANTWTDDTINNWFDKWGTAIQLDVDREERSARELNIRSMPTMVAFYNGREIGRVSGSLDSRAFLRWLEGIRRTHAPQLRPAYQAPERPAPAANPAETDLSSLTDRLRNAADTGGEAEARAYIRHLIQTLGQTQAGWWVAERIKTGQLALLAVENDVRPLLNHADAQRAFRSTRSSVSMRSMPGSMLEPQAPAAYASLSVLLNDQRGLSGWWARIEKHPEKGTVLDTSRAPIIDALLAFDMREEASQAIDNEPTEYARDLLAAARGEQGRGFPGAVTPETAYKAMGQAYATLLATGRENDAEAFADLLTDELDSAPMRQALAAEAVAMGQSRRHFSDWADSD